MKETALQKKELPPRVDRKEVLYEKSNKFFNALVAVILTIIILFATSYIVVFSFYSRVYIDGASMYPTLNNFTNSQYREFGLMNTHKSHFKRGDIIVFDRSNDGSGDYLVKRVIGLPNETIKITDGGGAALADYIDISYDGSTFRLDESYLTDVAKTSTYAGAFATYSPLTLSENQYFLMGDNRANSQDSRMIGPIDKTQITGKLLVLYGYAENVLTETDGNGQVMNTLVNKHYYPLWEMRFFL